MIQVRIITEDAELCINESNAHKVNTAFKSFVVYSILCIFWFIWIVVTDAKKDFTISEIVLWNKRLLNCTAHFLLKTVSDQRSLDAFQHVKLPVEIMGEKIIRCL